MEKFRLGDGLRDGTTLGPLINPKAVDFVQGHVDDAVQKGAKVGRPPTDCRDFCTMSAKHGHVSDAVCNQHCLRATSLEAAHTSTCAEDACAYRESRQPGMSSKCRH